MINNLISFLFESTKWADYLKTFTILYGTYRTTKDIAKDLKKRFGKKTKKRPRRKGKRVLPRRLSKRLKR